MALVLSTHALHPEANRIIGAEADLEVATSLAPDQLSDAARDADVIIVRAPLPAELFSRATRLRAAIRHGAGVDMIPLEAASAAGVLVANTPGANATSVAEYVMFCCLTLARRFRLIDGELRTKGWNESRQHAATATELGGKTMGLIGVGHVGRAISELAQAFQMEVTAFKPHCEGMPAGVKWRPLETVIADSDFLVLCCPLTPATHGLMNFARLSLMRPTAFLINAARGPIVVEADLLRVLDAGRIAGAALDVFSEQPLPRSHVLLGRENVLLTPHLAGITQESMLRMGLSAARETVRVLNGELPENLVNPEAIARFRARFAVGQIASPHLE